MTSSTFQSYGKTFQEKLAFLILEDRIFADRMIEVLQINFFEIKYLQVFVSKIFDYKKKFKVHPGRSTIETILRTSLEKENEVLQKQIVDYYAKMVSNSTIDDAEYVKTEALDFARKQKLHEAMLKSASLLKSNSFEEISKLINNALKAGEEIDTGHEFVKDFEKRYVENVRNPIPTGWQQLDELTNGGMGRREFGIILAPSGGGKSLFLTHLACHAVKCGYNVIFYTLELSAEMIGLRADACISGIPIDELKANKDRVFNIIKDVKGQLIVKQYAKKSASTTTIKNNISRLKNQGFVPDMVIVDYMDLLKPSSARKELRHEIGEVYDEFEAICQEENVAGWSVSQVHRAGFSADVISMENTSEALNKNFGSYLTLGLARTTEDKSSNTGRLSVCKNRNGPDGMIYNIFMDPANVDIKLLDLYDPRKEKKTLVNPQEQKRRMKVKYEQYKLENEAKN